ncbi:DNA repair protein RecN [Oscillibacter ruminantium]|uniref:DNA repair protein RecN n=1 Tax=Oscillibacter ruminantium TaxID=1263547 RepID=UPI002B2086A8|nr:DNA repair protein RecN [Oscillibacter ruminantium]MEA5042101.1 DNA repair protein RecN [Oscillibacter ruminantium]
MLELLHIENIAVIEQADIQFRPGFNALTGETGAGKSIVIDAMGAVLGGRTSRDLIRTGSKKAVVSAEFSGVSSDLPGLAECGAEPDEDGLLMIQREIDGDGKNFCRINGRPVTVSQLRALGANLLNIHGQHDGQQLLDEEQHGAYLDRFGRLESALNEYRGVYDAMAELRRSMDALRMDEAEKARKVDSLHFQIDELERAELRSGEDEELQERRDLLRNGEKYLSAVSGADHCLNGDDETGGAVALLQEAENALTHVKGHNGRLEEIWNRLEQLRCEAYDLAETVRDLVGEFDFSPEELDQVESRSDQLYRLKKKYGATIEEMLEYLDRSRRELDEIETADDTLVRLEGQLVKAQKAVSAAGAALTKARKAAASELEQRILKELKDLDMNRVRFSIEFMPKEPGPDGCDAIRFLMSANAGEDLKPIARIASGGELARIMLALKNVLAEQERVGTLVFDEVDTGVSGRAAQKVAEKLAQVSRHKQVLCVTHLPQLAAMADSHFSVEKGEREGRTFTEVVQLDRQRRMAELARLTGGSKVTDALLQSAGELLDEAEAYRKKL